MTQYGLIGKSISNGKINGYFVVDGYNNQKFLSVDTIIQLAEHGVIANWEVVTDDEGNKYLYSQDSTLSDLPNMVKDDLYGLRVINRLIQGKKLVGYQCISMDGIKYNYGIDKVWQLVKLGMIEGLEAKRVGNRRVLESADKQIKSLKSISLGE